jgi:hypothetical protein
VGTGAALALSLVLSFVIGLFSLRVKALFYAMITLAVAAAIHFDSLAIQRFGPLFFLSTEQRLLLPPLAAQHQVGEGGRGLRKVREVLST